MRRIKSRDTKPELLVRRLVHGMGYRYRLHRRDLPGKPDLVFGPKRKAIFVHGCFWHGHDDPACPDKGRPKSNLTYWGQKLARNRARDEANIAALTALGWDVLVIWDCATRDIPRLSARLSAFLSNAAVENVQNAPGALAQPALPLNTRHATRTAIEARHPRRRHEG